MKNFSLKALGAFIFAAGLVVAGIAAPAYATNITSSISTTPANTAFSPSSNTPAFTVTIPSASISSNINYISIGASLNGNNWFMKNTCPSYGSRTDNNLAECGITNIKIGPTDVTGWSAYQGGVTYTGVRILKTGTALSTSTANIEITFAAGAFVTPSGNGNYTFGVGTETNGGTAIDLATTNILVGTAPSYTVTFNGNGSTGGTTSQQTASGQTALTSNGFTRTGYTFEGWSTSPTGTVAYQNGANYPFTSSGTLYAKWTSNGGGGSSSTASLSLNASTGQLVAGSSVAVRASGLQSTAAYTVVVQSTPQTIGSGNALGGVVNSSVTLPAGLEAGWHTLTFTSTSSTGSAVESKYYFKISASGTLLSTSSTIPAELANTGVDSTSAMLLLAGGLSLALVGAEMFMIARRKRSN